MALNLINLSGYQRGVESAEAGINIESIQVRYFPQYKEYLKSSLGIIVGFAVPSALSCEVTIQGEVNGATGLMAATHTAAVSIANDTSEFSGGNSLYLDEATVSQGREAWKSLSMKLIGHPSGSSVTYVGTSAFTLQKEEPRGTIDDIPTVVETWRGAAALATAFRSSHALGGSHNGGYITDYSTRAGGPYTEVDIIVSRAPSFNDVQEFPSTSIKTATKSADVGGGKATKEISYEAPETRYSYFSSSKPNGPRYKSSGSSRPPVILRSKITYRVTGEEDEIYTGLLAPANIVAALSWPEEDLVTGHEGSPIPGTPWYRCTDTVTRGFKGDE